MLRDVLGANAPLYGRRTQAIHLKPMPFADVCQFYSNTHFADLTQWYAFFGGVPAYAEKAGAYDSPQAAAVDLILNENGILYPEPEFLVREELREPGVYFSILRSLAAGNTRPNEIAQDAGVPHSGVNKYLDTLRRMQMIERRVPLTEKHPERSTKALYVLSDHFLRFWFRYVFPNRSIIELGKGETLYSGKIKPDLNNFIGPVYEDMCHQEIIRNGIAIIGWEPFRIGRYWDPKCEIDLVVEDLNGEKVAFIECKWGMKVHIDRTLRKLRQKSDAIPQYAGRQKSYYVMSRTATHHKHHIRFNEAL